MRQPATAVTLPQPLKQQGDTVGTQADCASPSCLCGRYPQTASLTLLLLHLASCPCPVDIMSCSSARSWIPTSRPSPPQQGIVMAIELPMAGEEYSPFASREYDCKSGISVSVPRFDWAGQHFPSAVRQLSDIHPSLSQAHNA